MSLLSRVVLRRCLTAGCLLAVAVLACSCRVTPGPRPFFRRDLRPYGFPTDSHGRIVGNFSDIAFLTNDLVLVTVNTTTFGTDDDSSTSDLPESKLLLFDLSRGSPLKTVDMPVRKAKDSVQSAGNGSFLLLNQQGLQNCSRELECGPATTARGPMFLSPQGTRVAVGRLLQRVLDGTTLVELQEFGANEPRIAPGDNGLLYRQQGRLFVKLADHPEPQLVLDDGSAGFWPEARFLNANTISVLQSDKSVAIARLDGTILARVRLSRGSFIAEVSTTASGSRFCFHDAGYTGLNALLNFFSIQRPFNLERVNVMDVATGKSHFRMRWDPRPYVGALSRPELSPDGHRVALVRHGFFEVFDVR